MIQLETKNISFFGNDKNIVKKIYSEAFPKKEQMPFFLMLLMSKLWNTDLLYFVDKNSNSIIGMMYLAKGIKNVFVMFFAIDKNIRSNGYGSKVLSELLNRYPNKKIVITIEECNKNAADYELRCRRRAFYFRNGFTPTGFLVKLAGVTQEVIVANGKFNKWLFKLFLLLYSCGAMFPRFWKNNTTN